jgi:hypothetical protein
MPTKEACEFVKKNCSGFLIAYPEDINQMPWIDSCFPSKFTQFIHTNLPILVVAPQESAISIWCEKNSWELLIHNYNRKTLIPIFKLLMNKHDWERLCSQSQKFSKIFFDPDQIHNNLKLTINEHDD